MTDEGPRHIVMRAPCKYGCPSSDGYVVSTNGQDVVRCLVCDRGQYNAPRTETGRAVRSNASIHNGIKPKLRTFVINRAGCRCERCGASGAGVVLHVGHLIPVDHGLKFGIPTEELNDEENLTCECEACNLGQGAEPTPLRVAMAILRARIAWRKAQEKRK